MRSGAARGHAGHFHEAGFYSSDAEFRALIVPFAQEGIAAGEPVIIGYDDRKRPAMVVAHRFVGRGVHRRQQPVRDSRAGDHHLPAVV